MPVSRSANSYLDCRLVLDAAIAAGGGRYELASPGKALHWRQRAYTFRRILRDNAVAATIIPGLSPSTPYDHIELIADGPVVIIRLVAPKGILTDALGNPIDLKPTAPSEDELDLEAQRLLADRG